MNSKRRQVIYGILTLCLMLITMIFMSYMLGKGIRSANPYNTYALQADSWRQGRLHLGRDYRWLELAVYEGKYYCSFPPFPSYVLFPLTFIFGSNTPDFAIMYLVNILLTIYLYFLALKLGTRPEISMLLTLFVTVGANTLFIMQTPWVWFFAQLLCFLTATMAIFYAYQGKGGFALFLWACSVGCRPMQIVYLPVLLMVLYRHERGIDAEASGLSLVIRRLYWAIPMGVVAVSYMILNYFRFGSVTEFGRKYLPEFMRASKGQFHVDYMVTNFRLLMNLPDFSEDGKLIISRFGNLNFMLVSPIIIVSVLGMVYVIVKRDWNIFRMGLLIICMTMVYLMITIMHRTMGAWHFGNRYTIDILPYIYLLVGMISARYPKLVKLYLPFLVCGIVINIVGTIVVYNG